jgi:hypothetical protein
MSLSVIFDELWSDYSKRTPSAKKIKALFESKGEMVKNDHVAFRTFDIAPINIDVLSTLFLENGYEYVNDYQFDKKKLVAKHFAHKTDKDAPLVFISELITKECSQELQAIVHDLIKSVDFSELSANELLFKGRLWDTPSYRLYSMLLEESEYAAWLYVNGFCANHFTVNVNELENFDSLEEVNDFLEYKNYKLNSSGGKIKGSKADFLEQSSVLADKIEVDFQEGRFEVTSCYYEFAFRHQVNGELFKGFIANSADKIFESTDMLIKN